MTALLCMQADVASSSMAAEHDACTKPEPREVLQQSLHSAVDLTLPVKAQLQRVCHPPQMTAQHICMRSCELKTYQTLFRVRRR